VSRDVCEVRRCQGRGVCVPVKTCVSVYVGARLACIGERACARVCMCVHLFFSGAWAYRFVCMFVCSVNRRAYERVHAFVREFECVCLVRWEALIAMLACAAGRRDAAPHRLWKGPLGGG
jgi:hypothetical protein